MNFSNIVNLNFGKDTEKRDDHLMALLKRAYQGEVLCTMAIADIRTIKPYSRFKPKISDDYRRYFMEQRQTRPPALHVYTKDGKLVMSDDYHAYWMYKETEMSEVLCIVIGDTPVIDGVEYAGKPFRMQPPSFTEI
jgi:hypothetical protein